MANIQSQIKRNRQNERRRLRNKAVRSALKTYEKRFGLAVQASDKAAAAEAFAAASRKLDQAATRGVVHANYAANHKSKMAHRLAQL